MNKQKLQNLYEDPEKMAMEIDKAKDERDDKELHNEIEAQVDGFMKSGEGCNGEYLNGNNPSRARVRKYIEENF